MKPTKNRIFCQQAFKVKMLFESESKANNFIRFNKEDIAKNAHSVPCRSYFCVACGGWHITHLESFDEEKEQEYIHSLEKKRREIPAKAINKPEEEAEQMLKELKSLIKWKTYGDDALSLIAEIAPIIQKFRQNTQPTNRQTAIMERYEKYCAQVQTHLIREYKELTTLNQPLTIGQINALSDIAVEAAQKRDADKAMKLIKECEAWESENQLDPRKLEYSRRRILQANTLIACHQGTEAIKALEKVEVKALLRFMSELFERLEIEYRFVRYDECTSTLKELFICFQKQEENDTNETRVETMRKNLLSWVKKIQQSALLLIE